MALRFAFRLAFKFSGILPISTRAPETHRRPPRRSCDNRYSRATTQAVAASPRGSRRSPVSRSSRLLRRLLQDSRGKRSNRARDNRRSDTAPRHIELRIFLAPLIRHDPPPASYLPAGTIASNASGFYSTRTINLRCVRRQRFAKIPLQRRKCPLKPTEQSPQIPSVTECDMRLAIWSTAVGDASRARQRPHYPRVDAVHDIARGPSCTRE